MHDDTLEMDRPARAIDRRNLLGGIGLGSLGAALLSAMGPVGAVLASGGTARAATAITDQDILNFALNLEYLEGEFYLRGTTGNGLPDDLIQGTGTLGGVNGGRAVPFKTALYTQFAQKIALDEALHVGFLRSQLGSAAVARPLIDLAGAFQAAALASGAVPVGGFFDPFANETDFFLAAAALTEVGVTAYAGAASLIASPAVLTAAAQILATESYHAGAIRAVLGQTALAAGGDAVAFRSQAFATFESQASTAVTPENPIQTTGIVYPQNGVVNIVPVDANSLVFRRTPPQVLNVVYGGDLAGGGGGFFPQGLNGNVR